MVSIFTPAQSSSVSHDPSEMLFTATVLSHYLFIYFPGLFYGKCVHKRSSTLTPFFSSRTCP